MSPGAQKRKRLPSYHRSTCAPGPADRKKPWGLFGFFQGMAALRFICVSDAILGWKLFEQNKSDLF